MQLTSKDIRIFKKLLYIILELRNILNYQYIYIYKHAHTHTHVYAAKTIVLFSSR